MPKTNALAKMSFDDIAASRARFKKCWPKCVERIGKLTGEELDEFAKGDLAFYHIRAICEIHPEVAHDLADGRITQVLREEHAIEDFLNGRPVPEDISDRTREAVARQLGIAVRALGYGREETRS